ncbi:hypothetical protein PROFUN_03032 [Planoprotostelium fungivorum]|uniref:HIG1 domain-containing protein n=1 Tax=Planoprotostelium fungivorum TaxID=1890364 RepID=A0A2P6NXD4_9EUKA|nr:hypothetical protein PROFUN_03032 [Planoprotostelium fungivorum]
MSDVESSEREKIVKRKFTPVQITGLVGLGATTCALGYGLYAFSNNQKRKSNVMMRYRVLFQFLTISAMWGLSRHYTKKHEWPRP